MKFKFDLKIEVEAESVDEAKATAAKALETLSQGKTDGDKWKLTTLNT